MQTPAVQVRPGRVHVLPVQHAAPEVPQLPPPPASPPVPPPDWQYPVTHENPATHMFPAQHGKPMVPHEPVPPASPPPIIMPASPPPVIIPASPPEPPGWQYPVTHENPAMHVLPAQHG